MQRLQQEEGNRGKKLVQLLQLPAYLISREWVEAAVALAKKVAPVWQQAWAPRP
jgi:hypothetical protein